MPKIKTKSAAKKRFKKVGGKKNGKIKRAKGFRRHLLTKKTKKNKRQLRKSAYVSEADYKSIARLLPY
ncbi:MAG TPA: 50S ribosomal protein L35 [Candidatus Dependentiae bacterium]|nr:50S ribosomal protein L35 [Candidatus Dependentiae bacterium]HRQ62482.1 50S ribosomal protein L35 [Candidatus Dependentiae bacterium]